MGVRMGDPGIRVGGIVKERVGVSKVSAFEPSGEATAQMEAGVMERSDGWDVLQALKFIPIITTTNKGRHLFRNLFGNIAGFYQFLLQSS